MQYTSTYWLNSYVLFYIKEPDNFAYYIIYKYLKMIGLTRKNKIFFDKQNKF